MAQYPPMRFHTSAAGRFTVISIGIETYVGFATTMLAAAGGAAGAGAWVLAVRPATSIANTTHAAAVTNLVLIGDYSFLVDDDLFVFTSAATSVARKLARSSINSTGIGSDSGKRIVPLSLTS